MNDYGLRIWRADGTLQFDSSTHAGAAFVERLVIPLVSNSGSKVYDIPGLENKELFLVQEGYGSHDAGFSFSGVWPMITWVITTANFSYPSVFWVFAR